MLKQDDRQTADLRKTLVSFGYKEIKHLDRDIRSQAVYRLDEIFNKFFVTMIKLIDNNNGVINITGGKSFDRITQDVRSCSKHWYPGFFVKVTSTDIFGRLKFDFKNPTHLRRRIK
jgi:hypothetical protein